MHDATAREMIVVVPLLALSLFIGLYSQPVIDRVEPTVKCVMRTFERRDEPVTAGAGPGLARGREGVPMIAAVTVPRVDWYSIAPVVMPVAAAILIVLFRAVARDRVRTYEPALVDRRARPGRVGVLPGQAVERRHRPRARRRDGAHDRRRRLLGVRRHGRDRQRVAHAAAVVRLPRAARDRVAAGVRRAAAVLGRRHAHDGGRQRPHRRVRGARGPLDPALRPRRVRPAPRPVARGGHQVLRAGRLLVGDLPLRRRAGLRGDRHARRSRESSRFLATHVLADEGTLLAGVALLLVGSGLQDRRRAVPHVDARRLRGRAEPGDRVHGVGDQGGRLRRAAPRAVHGPGPVPDRLAQPVVRARRAHAARGQHRRAAPDRPQAAARVLVDRARRLRADRRAGRHGARPAVGARLPARLRVHDDRRVRARRRARRTRRHPRDRRSPRLSAGADR